MRCVVPKPGSPCVRCERARRSCVGQPSSAQQRQPSAESRRPRQESPTCLDAISSPALDRSRQHPGLFCNPAAGQSRRTSRCEGDSRTPPVLPNLYTTSLLAQAPSFHRRDLRSAESVCDAESELDWETLSGLSNEEAMELYQVWDSSVCTSYHASLAYNLVQLPR